MKLLKNFYLTSRFFWVLLGLAAVFAMAFMISFLMSVAQILLSAFIVFFFIDILSLYTGKKGIEIERNYPEKLSNGDENDLSISIKNGYPFKVLVKVLEEIPIQFQYRDFQHSLTLNPDEKRDLSYSLRPTERGKYIFGKCNVLVQRYGLIARRFQLGEERILACYPSFIQLRKYSLLATTNRLTEVGVKKLRRVGNTMEFELIKEYVPGDDYRFINWKATAKVNKVMVNQYQEEKSQPIYSLIDLSRNMRMPFEELTLLDYAINASLVLSNISIIKQDRAGILTFSNAIGTHVPAQRNNRQMQKISEALYHIKTEFKEAEFGRLYSYVRRQINQRSLLFLYTNFETIDAMQRQLPYIRILNKSHIVVVVIFKNTELTHMADVPGENVREIYNQIIAEKLVYEKNLIVQKLQRNGLQVILTEPQNLTVNSINKYLQIKARGLI